MPSQEMIDAVRSRVVQDDPDQEVLALDETVLVEMAEYFELTGYHYSDVAEVASLYFVYDVLYVLKG